MSLERLFDRRTQGIRLGLEVVHDVWHRLGAPASTIPAIHVVGTNGKGSTSAMIAHALAGSGRRVGLYTSPHLHRVAERVVIAGEPDDDAALEAAVDRVLACERQVELPRQLSFFEVLTLAAWLRFEASGLDVLVAEAGMGGRLDATRICRAVAVAIARIDLDHQAFLGSTLGAIAGEKVAVARADAPTFSVAQAPEAAAVIAEHVAAIGGSLQIVAPLARPPVGLFGEHQRDNAALALAAARVVVPSLVERDLDGVRWAGRFEVLRLLGGTLVLDVAHNPAGVAALVSALQDFVGPDSRATIAIGCVAGKDGDAMAASVAAHGGAWAWVDLAGFGAEGHPLADAPEHLADAVALTDWIARRLAAAQTVCVCGSHVIVAAARAWALGLGPAEPGERTGASPQAPPSRP